MGKTKDRAIIFEAADHWHDELVDEIIPNVMTNGERKSYRRQADKLHNALVREQARLERKRIRDGSQR